MALATAGRLVGRDEQGSEAVRPPGAGAAEAEGGRCAPIRHPEATVLYRVVQEHLATFLARAEREGGLPRFVRQELVSYLECGIPAHGFIRVRCPECRLDGLVAFSCKGRGFCPSCGGRRMADTAAHLVDRVLPEAPVRQWVLSLPYPLRFLLAYDRGLCTRVLDSFAKTLLGWYRRRGREWLGFSDGGSGTVTAIQRFGSALNLNLHFHVLALDGVYTGQVEPGGPAIRFHGLVPPETAEVEALLRVVSRRIVRVLVRSGRLRETAEGYEVVGREEWESGSSGSALASCQAGSVRGRVALGARAGARVRRVGDRVEAEFAEGEGAGARGEVRCAEGGGFSLHADVAVDGGDRKRLERLCRYILRPAVASERLREREDGRIEYELRRPWRDGTRAVVLEPLELIERLVALVPAPRGHLVRYHGVLAGRARWRRLVARDRGGAAGATAEADGQVEPSEELRERRLSWAELMKRVFEVDVLECPRCGGRRKLIGVITEGAVVSAILDSLGLPTRAPPQAPARREDGCEQRELEWQGEAVDPLVQ